LTVAFSYWPREDNYWSLVSVDAIGVKIIQVSYLDYRKEGVRIPSVHQANKKKMHIEDAHEGHVCNML